MANEGVPDAASEGILEVRVRPPPRGSGSLPPGLTPLGLGTTRDGLLYCSPRCDPDRPAPLLIMLHGAGARAAQALSLLPGLEQHGPLVVLAPDARRASWDVIQGGYGPDVAFLRSALAFVLDRQRLDPARVGIGGFSDGASYALSLGLINGNLFSHVIAFSPGFMAPTRERDHPKFFVSHGRSDEVLPISRCGRRLAARLERSGYPVIYREFPDGHVVPPGLAREALDWFLASPGSGRDVTPARSPYRPADGSFGFSK